MPTSSRLDQYHWLVPESDEAQRIPQSIRDRMNFSAKTAFRSSQGFSFERTACCSGSTSMGPGYRIVDQYLLHIRILATASMQALPDIMSAPA